MSLADRRGIPIRFYRWYRLDGICESKETGRSPVAQPPLDWSYR